MVWKNKINVEYNGELFSLIFSNDRVQTISMLLRQDIVKKKKIRKNNKS